MVRKDAASDGSMRVLSPSPALLSFRNCSTELSLAIVL